MKVNWRTDRPTEECLYYVTLEYPDETGNLARAVDERFFSKRIEDENWAMEGETPSTKGYWVETSGSYWHEKVVAWTDEKIEPYRG